MMLIEVILLILGTTIVVLYAIACLNAPPYVDINGEHVIVTGGSSGIGKAVAIDLAKRGASITLVARNLKKLQDAKKEVEKHFKTKTQKVMVLSIDLAQDYKAVEAGFKEVELAIGPVVMLVNSAGLAINSRFEDTAMADFSRSMDINYMGSVYATRAVIEGMKARQKGRIVYVSSVAGQVGIYGYTAYSASKYALKGLAEALQMEVKPYNIRVTMAFPPDTDTPGYQEELKTKPEETRLISETAGLFPAQDVAEYMMDDALRGKFQSFLGVDGWMLSHLTAGMGPSGFLMDSVVQVFTVGLFRAVALGYLSYFDTIVKRCKRKREEAQESNRKDQ